MANTPPLPTVPPAPSERPVDPVPSDARTLRLEQLGEVLANPSQPTIALPEASAAGESQHDPRDFEGKPFGRYRLLTELGRGGMGVVHKAWDTQLRRHVALKQILSEGGLARTQVDRFLREARLAARLRHPHIVGVLDVGEHEGRPYLTTEYREARSLEAVMRQPVEVVQALRWVQAIAEALQYAHDAGIIHRDIKPSNVLIDAEGRPALTDFGLAKEVEAPVVGGTTLTLSGALVGTPQYMSPEQASGRPERLGPAADQFSLGVVLYELLTGQLPFSGSGLRELLNAISEQEPVPPRRLKPSIGRDAETICLKVLDKDPSRRYARIGDLAADVGRLLAGEAIVARPRSLGEKAVRFVSRHRRVVFAVATTAALVLAAGVPYLRERARHAEQIQKERNELDRQAAAAERGRQEALIAVEKAGKAQAVFGRWMSLASHLRALEAAYYDGRLSNDELRRRVEEPWQRVERFLEETPPDPTSQSVARALAGRARQMAGHLQEGLEWMREAQRLDPDLPHGALMEALAHFADFTQVPLHPSIVSRERVEFDPRPPERSDVTRAQTAIERLLEQAARARVWGEGTGRDLRNALDAIRAVQEGRLEEAERRLSDIIGSPAMLGCEGDILLARAKVRYGLGKPREGIEDLERLLELRPEDGVTWLYLGDLLTALAIAESIAGRDPVPLLDQAVERLSGALERDVHPEVGLSHRGIALGVKGEAQSTRGLDGREALDAALRDFTDVIHVDPGDAQALANRAGVQFWRANAEGIQGGNPIPYLDAGLSDLEKAGRDNEEVASMRQVHATLLLARGVAGRRQGEDSRELLQRAVEELGRHLADRPGDVEALACRGDVYLEMAIERSMRGEDAAEACDLAVRDLEEARRLAPNDSDALLLLGKTHHLRGDLARDAGEEPDAHYEKALAELDRAVALRSWKTDAWTERGLTRRDFGAVRNARRVEARDVLQGAIDDFDEVLARTPRSLDALNNRSTAWMRFAEAQWNQGEDPRPSFERAIADCDEVIRRAPTEATAWTHRALARWSIANASEQAGEDPRLFWDEALADLVQVLKLEPSSWRAHASRGMVLARQGRKEEAIAAYEEALRICPGNPTVKAQLDTLRGK